jgi:membrane protease YdiL (CAAX protease family)
MRGDVMSDRNQALVFVVSVLAISWGFEAFIIANGGIRNFGLVWIVALMCIPGALSIVLRLILKSGFGDTGFRVGKGRYYLYAVAVPLLLALLVGFISAALDIRNFSPVRPEQLTQLSPVLLSVLGLGLIGAFGEELGWRGFLLPKMISGGVKSPYLVSGLVWASWHLPLIAFGGFYQGDNALLMALVYGVGIIAMSFVFSELRVRSGSVWVAAIVHAAHNFFFQFALPVLLLTVPGSRSHLWDMVIGDTGLFIAVLYAFAYLVIRHIVPQHRTSAGRDDAHRRMKNV